MKITLRIIKTSPGASWIRPSYIIVCLLLMATLALACRYSVRDVGFVELQPKPYRLIYFYDPESAPQKSALESVKSAATAIFLDANVRLDPAEFNDSAYTDYWNRLTDPKPALPFGLLVDPEDRTLSIPYPPENPESSQDTLKERAWSWVESIVKSPGRDKILALAPVAYAVTLLVEGDDPQPTEKARQSITTAILEISEFIPSMPKPVDTPPKLSVISAKQREAEKILLWSLGMEWKATSDPQVATIMGKGRRIGPSLPGPLITATRLREILSVIGQDCECELDRSWMQGPMIPAVYGREFRQEAYVQLGFDPENPSVKSEISRIISRGPNSQNGSTSVANAPSAAVENLFMGYSEQSLETESSDSMSLEELKKNARALLGKSSAKQESSAQALAKLEVETEQNSESLTDVESADGSEFSATNLTETEMATKTTQSEELAQTLPSNSSVDVTVEKKASNIFVFLILGGAVVAVLLVGGWIMMRSI